jgi:SWI/SNF-related matrix-associated actin-dependent regulator of chromatin subfamily A member 5
MDRAHRIGQKKEVQVFRFCTEHSIEEKVIEKAYKKLRLDALVIQQGRLTDGKSAAKVNKDDLLSMVRYGAELVFSSEAANITDADIEAILKKGESDTALLNEKMQQFTDKANKALALDGGMSVYDFKDDEGGEGAGGEGGDRGASAAAVIKAAMAENWADPGERKRKRPVGSYSEAEYFRQAGVTKGGAPGGGGGGMKGGNKGAGGVKVPAMNEWQFFDVARITALYEKENRHLQRKPEAEAEAARAKAAALARGEDEAAADEQAQAAMAAALDGAEPLTEAELDERRALQAEGFGNWSKKDYNNFLRACARHGRGNLQAIAQDVDAKPPKEVERYARAFWSRGVEGGGLSEPVRDHAIREIEKGEAKIQRVADIMTAIRRKLAQYKDPWQELKLAYGQSKGRAFTEEEDRFLLCAVDALGYGQWEEVKASIRLHWRFRFDWFFKSRTATELSRRTEVLVRLIERENEEAAAAGGGGGGTAGGAGGGGGRKSVAFEDDLEAPDAKRSRPGSSAPPPASGKAAAEPAAAAPEAVAAA